MPSMMARNKKMIDVAVRLKIGITHYFSVFLSHERANMLHSGRPTLWVKVGRSPRINLFRGVVFYRNQMDGSIKYIEQ
ncbi:AlpA family transcriptional regulator [Pseudomonas aeruginosa ATCC 14886]|nr:AlpA family transcriptional regulator [Pseudomonas aeruginosa ATCC 14886]